MKTSVNLTEYLPDQGSLAGGLTLARNCFPISVGYGPARDFSSQTSALPADFKGGGAFIGTDGTPSLLVGTSDGISMLVSGSWTNVLTGASITTAWAFAQFGNYVIGVNGVQTKVTNLTGGTGSTSTLTDAPAGTSVAVVGDYVVIGGDSSDLLSVRTSGFNNHTDWDYTDPASTATYQPMLTGGEVMGVAGGEYGVILQRERLVRMTRTGDSAAPFAYDEISAAVGCASRGSVCQLGRTVFFLSDKGFMSLEDGQSLVPIGVEKIDREFQTQVPRPDYDKIVSAVDPQNKLVIWCVPGRPGLLWVYQYVLKRWSVVRLRIEGLFSGYTLSASLEEVAVDYPDLDAMTISLDDPRFEGGAPRLYAVRDRQVGTLSGATLSAEFRTSFLQFANGRIARVRTLRPITDCATGHAIQLDMRSRMGDPENFTDASAIRSSGVMPIRCSGRYARAYWATEAGQEWTFCQGFEVDFEAGGER